MTADILHHSICILHFSNLTNVQIPFVDIKKLLSCSRYFEIQYVHQNTSKDIKKSNQNCNHSEDLQTKNIFTKIYMHCCNLAC